MKPDKPTYEQPPKRLTRFVARLVAPHLREEVLGDLHERYALRVEQTGETNARRRYWREILAYMRPAFIKRKPTEYPTSSFLSLTMIRNYIKIAFRTLRVNKGYSFINIFGLATGMAVAMLIGLWVWDELSYNKYHANYDRLAQVMQHQSFNGRIGTQQSIPIPLITELRTKYGANFKHLAIATWQSDHILTYGSEKVNRSGNYMEPDIPEMLSLKMVKGSRDGLRETNTILLSESTAQALFGGINPVGKLVRIDNESDVVVTGVYENLPYNDHFRDLTFITTWDLFLNVKPWAKRSRDEQQWDNNSFQIFAQIADNTDMDRVSANIKDAKLNNVKADSKKYNPTILLQPMRKWHLYEEWKDGINAGGFVEYVRLFALIGVFVLLLACINFMNLSTARSEKRAKEVGIRKAVGSVRSQLVGQFFSESFLTATLAFVGALLLLILLLPWFNQVADKKLTFPGTELAFWLLCVGFIFTTGLLAGSYPAFYLSSFQPIKVLKGTFKAGRSAAMPRKVLVVIQFMVSVTLIIGTSIVYRQIQYTKDRPIGYDTKGLIMIQMKTPEFGTKYDALKTDLMNTGVITDIAQASSPLTESWSNSSGFYWPGKDPSQDGDGFNNIWVTHEYGKTVGWQFKEGRDFSRKFSTDTSAIVVNEAAVKFMGLRHPVGTVIRSGSGAEAIRLRIVGVIKDMLMESPYEPVKQTFYFLNQGYASWIILRLNPYKAASESLAAIETVIKKDVPSAPFEYQFADDEFGKKFVSEERIGKLAGGFAILAIFISCLGLFGLAAFSAEQRTKEIGIRKVLGATVLNLWGLLSKDFVVLVLIAFAIATPIAYYFLDGWLQKYLYHTELSWWIFAASGAGVLALTLLTVSFQSIKAALMNPVRSLRSE